MTKDWETKREPIMCARCKGTQANGNEVETGLPLCQDCAAVLDRNLDTAAILEFVKVELWKN